MTGHHPFGLLMLLLLLLLVALVQVSRLLSEDGSLLWARAELSGMTALMWACYRVGREGGRP